MRHVCLECLLHYETERTDSKFCSGACKAAYYRKHGDTDEHADLDRFKSKTCEFCGATFWFNAYADRGGKRTPSYCRDAHRVGAFRARQRDANARADDSWRQYKSEKERQYEQDKSRRSEGPPRAKRAKSDTPYETPMDSHYANLRVPARWSASAACEWLGVPPYSELPVCQKAFRTLMSKYHPDKTGGKIWPYLVHVSAAFDYMKRLYK